jgi:replicative DNA helicase
MNTEYLKDEDVEEVVLGAMMLEYDAYDKICGIINEGCFYNSKNKAVFSAIEHLNKRGEDVDILTVYEELKTTKKDVMVGGALYISKLTNRVASAAHIEKHARILVQKYAQRELWRLGAKVQKDMSSNEDPFECISTILGAIDDVNSLVAAGVGVKEFSDILTESYEEYERRKQLRKENRVVGIPSVIRKITEHNQGWQGGKLIIVAGRPGQGKTAYALAEARNMTDNGYFPLFFSLEMPSRELTDRLLIMQAENMCLDVESGLMKRFSAGYMTAAEEALVYKAKKELEGKELYIDDNTNCDVNHIRSVAKLRKKEGKCDAIFIDYLQLMDCSSEQNREREVAKISRELKIISKELNVPIFLLCQLNRGVEQRPTKRPYMSDLRESGAIEQDADIIIFPWRPKYYIDQDSGFEETVKQEFDAPTFGEVNWRETGIIMIAKDRANGTRDFVIKINDSCTIWKDYSFEFKKEISTFTEPEVYDPSAGMDGFTDDLF